MKKLGVVIAAVIASLTAGVLPASASFPHYPPDDTTPGPSTTVLGGGGGGLPATGSDSGQTVQIATGIIAVGLGLAAVGGVRRRRHVDV